MLIILFYLLTEVVLPRSVNLTGYIFDNLLIALIVLFGIVLLLSAVGIRVPNPGSSIISGVFQLLKFIGSQIFMAIKWLIRAFIHAVPRIYRGNRTILMRYFNPVIAHRLAILGTILWVIIII